MTNNLLYIGLDVDDTNFHGWYGLHEGPDQ